MEQASDDPDNRRHPKAEALQRADDIWESISDAFIAVDADWKIVYVNRSYLDLVSPIYSSSSELLGKNLWERFPDVIGTDLARFYQRAMQTQQPGETHVFYEPIAAHVEVRAFPSPKILSIYARDITERKRQESALLELNEKVTSQARLFDGILSNIPDLAYAFDTEQRLIYANRALLDIWETTLEQAVGKHCVELVAPLEVGERLASQIRKVIEDKKPFGGEIFYLGEYHEYVYSPSLANDGSVVAVVGTTRLVTSRKRAEAAAEGQRRALQLIVDDAPLARVLEELILTVERQSSGEVRGGVLLSDERQEQLFRVSSPNFPSRLADALETVVIGPSARACGAAAWRKEPVVVTDILADPVYSDLREIAMEHGLRSCWATPIFSSGGDLLGVFSLYNLSNGTPTQEEIQLVEIATRTASVAIERKRVQSEVTRARDEAIAASRAKDDFLAALSHELRSPLNPALLLASESAEDPRMPEEARKIFASIRKSVMLEARLIDDLLDLTRISHGKMTLETQPVDLHEILQDAIAGLQSDFKSKRVALQVDLANRPALAEGDPARLQQVFSNVLKNGLKFTPSEGEVRISSHASANGEQLEVRISDTGEGMTDDELNYAFESFVQGEHASKFGASRFGGLGLGLAISSSIVKLHRGAIRASSEGRHKGSTFFITLPLAKAPRQSSAGPETDSPGASDDKNGSQRYDGRGRRILLVDDDSNTRRVLELLLKSRGFAVRAAGSVAEALAVAEEEKFDLLVSDIGLPDGTGYQLMSALAQRHNLRGIALSGYGMRKDREKSFAAGFIEHLVKPSEVQALEKALANAFADSEESAAD